MKNQRGINSTRKISGQEDLSSGLLTSTEALTAKQGFHTCIHMNSNTEEHHEKSFLTVLYET
jgi:hypothetical protein